MMTRFCSKKNYEQIRTKATEIHSHHCLYCDTTFPQFDDLIKHSRENHPYHCYYCKTTFVLFDIGVVSKQKVVRPIFFVRRGLSPIFFFRYMHKDKFLCIFSQIKNNAYLPVHLVHAPRFWWSPSYSFTFSFRCVFFQFLMSCNC